jgi:hypothetical protein
MNDLGKSYTVWQQIPRFRFPFDREIKEQSEEFLARVFCSNRSRCTSTSTLHLYSTSVPLSLINQPMHINLATVHISALPHSLSSLLLFSSLFRALQRFSKPLLVAVLPLLRCVCASKLHATFHSFTPRSCVNSTSCVNMHVSLTTKRKGTDYLQPTGKDRY